MSLSIDNWDMHRRDERDRQRHNDKVKEVIDRICKEQGYTPESANELLRYVGTLLNR